MFFFKYEDDDIKIIRKVWILYMILLEWGKFYKINGLVFLINKWYDKGRKV